MKDRHVFFLNLILFCIGVALLEVAQWVIIAAIFSIFDLLHISFMCDPKIIKNLDERGGVA